MASVQDVLDIARSQLGYKEEPPGSNHTKYGSWYGIDPAAWCAMFVSWCFNQAGMPLNMADQANDSAKGYASVGFGKEWFNKHGQLVNDPQAGDIVFFEWENDEWPDHTGLVESINADGTLNTIEGNSPGPDHTDEVARHLRNRQVARWFGRPAYDATTSPVVIPQPEPVIVPEPPINASKTPWGAANHPQLSKGASGDAVVHMQALLGALNADGSFGPISLARLKAVQAAHSLTTDGVCGPITWSHIHDVVKQGMTEPAVGEVQRSLNGLEVDNQFGPATNTTVRAFQAVNNLAVDGEVGPQTWQELLS